MARTLINSVDITPATTAQIGDIIHSMLTEAEFQAIRGTDWVLADGRDATGTGYGVVKTGDAVTPVNLPDLRGQFLRGKDHGRHAIDGNGNPDGDVALGTQAIDKIASHRHAIPTPVNNSQSYALASQPGFNQLGNTNHTGATDSITQSAFAGSNETAPKNVTVNIFIKIN